MMLGGVLAPSREIVATPEQGWGCHPPAPGTRWNRVGTEEKTGFPPKVPPAWAGPPPPSPVPLPFPAAHSVAGVRGQWGMGTHWGVTGTRAGLRGLGDALGGDYGDTLGVWQGHGLAQGIEDTFEGLGDTLGGV